MDIEMYKGDTVQIEVILTNNGEPYLPNPETEKVVFSVGKAIGKSPLFSIPVIDGIAKIDHELTNNIPIGKYLYDVRVYNLDKTLVATPCIGNFRLVGIVNNGI